MEHSGVRVSGVGMSGVGSGVGSRFGVSPDSRLFTLLLAICASDPPPGGMVSSFPFTNFEGQISMNDLSSLGSVQVSVSLPQPLLAHNTLPWPPQLLAPGTLPWLGAQLPPSHLPQLPLSPSTQRQLVKSLRVGMGMARVLRAWRWLMERLEIARVLRAQRWLMELWSLIGVGLRSSPDITPPSRLLHPQST